MGKLIFVATDEVANDVDRAHEWMRLGSPRTSTKQRTEQAHHTAVVPHIADGCDVGGPHKAFPRWDQLVHIVRCVHSSHTPLS